MILGQGTQVLMHVIDAAMIGRVGVRELAAAGLGNNAAAGCFFVGILLGSTVPVLAARAYGAGDRARMNLVLRHGLTLSFLYGVGAIALCAATAHVVLPWFGPPDVARMARPYALLLIASLLPALLVQNLRGFAEAQNRPWLPLGNIVLGVGLNVGLNYVLIYGRFGVPALGLPGAALGTLLARLAMLVHFAWLLRRQPGISPAPGAWRPLAWRAGLYPDYLRQALPAAGTGVVIIGSTVIVGVLMGRIGPTALAANEVARQISWLLLTAPFAFSYAIAIRVGHAAGANDPVGVRRVAGTSLLAVAGAMALAGLALALGRHVLPRWFVASASEGGETAIALIAQLLHILAWSLPAEGLMFAGIAIARGLGALAPAAGVYVAGFWVVGLPLGYTLAFAHGGGGGGLLTGIVIGNWLTATVLGGVVWWVLRRRSSRGADGKAAAV
jgi:MATE family multidrug resistance protein